MARHGLRSNTGLLAMAFLAACSDPASPGLYTTLNIGPAFSIAVKEQVAIKATVYGDYGQRLQVPPISWSSSNESVLTVDAAGTVTGRALGVATVSAIAGHLTSLVQVTVKPSALKLTLHSESAALIVGDSAFISATYLDYEGEPIPTGVGVNWEVDPVGRLTVQRHPRTTERQVAIIAHQPGLALVRADGGDMMSELAVAILPGPATNDFAASFYFFEHRDARGPRWYSPQLYLSVPAGRVIELLYFAAVLPGLPRRTYPLLCTSDVLSSGEHVVLGEDDYGVWFGLYADAPKPLTYEQGAALLTYRVEDGSIRVIAVRGGRNHPEQDAPASSAVLWDYCN